ncbi:MAG: YceI family protein [Conexibacter sp.]|jgi:polyisoprenoid-binding protein YceI|nr:YceI family protein [Conexibacter sp.]
MSAAATKVPTGTWNVDPSHSSVEFQVKHLGIATVKGSFKEFAGSLTAAEDGSIAVSGTVEVASVDTREAQRDEHLRSADFFDVENNPQIAFASTAIEHLDDETFKITGDITIHGVTKPITLEAVVEGTEEDPWGNQRVGLSATGQLSRGDFGMKFNQALGSGNVVVSDKVKLAIEVSAVRAA